MRILLFAIVVCAGCDVLFEIPHNDGLAGDAAVPGFVIEAENYTSNIPPGDAIHTWTQKADPLASGRAIMEALPNDLINCVVNIPSCGPELDFTVAVATANTYFIYVRMSAGSGANNSVWYGLDGMMYGTELDAPVDSTWHWVPGTSMMLGSGAHTLSLWMREPGTRIDEVALTTSSTSPP